MLARLFGNIHSKGVFFIAAYVLACLILHFALIQKEPLQLSGAFGYYNLSKWQGVFATGFLLLFSSFAYQWLFVDGYKLLKRHYFFTVLFTPLFLSCVSVFGLNFGLAVALVWFIFRLWLDCFGGIGVLHKTLSIGIFTGLLSLIDFSFLSFIPATLFVFLIFGLLNMRKFLILFVGLLTLLLNIWGIEYLVTSGKTAFQFFADGIEAFHIDPRFPLYIPVLGLIFLFVISLIEYFNTLIRANVMKRQVFTVSVVLFVFSFAEILFAGPILWLPVVAIPTCCLLFSNFLQYIKRRWLLEFWLWVAIGFWAILAFIPQAQL